MQGLEKLADLVKIAQTVGGSITYEGRLSGAPGTRAPTRTLRVILSSPRGGCGLGRCKCSSGWWVAADLEDQTVTVGFSTAREWRLFLDKLRVAGVNV